MIRSIRYFLIILSVSLSQFSAFGQRTDIDSLIIQLKTKPADTSKVDMLMVLAEKYFSHNDYQKTDSTLHVAEGLARQINYQKALAFIAVKKGNNMKHSISSIDSCKKLHDQALAIMSQLKDSTGMTGLYCMIGDHYASYHGNGALAHICYLNALSYCKDYESALGRKIIGALTLTYKRLGNYPKAIEFNLKLIQIYEKGNDKNGLARSYRSLSELFSDQNRLDLSLEYALKAYIISSGISEEYKHSNSYCYTIFSLSKAYLAKKDFKNAYKKADEGIRIAQEIKDKWAETDAWNNKGVVFQVDGKFEEAKKCFENARDAKISVNDTMPGLAYVYGNMAQLYYDMHKYKQAIYYAKRTIEMSRILQDIGQIHSMVGILSLSLEKENNFKDAYYYHVQYKNLSDSLFSVEKISAMEAIRLEHEFGKKEALISEQQEKERLISEEKGRKQKIIIWSVIGGLALVVLFAGFMFRSLRITRKQKHIIELKNIETEKQKHIIEAKNKDITDSINYARRIQQAKLPHKKEIYNVLENSFVLFKPKDIVSGDFYYLHKKENEIFIASADCTGHGVPGAFMSLIGFHQLDAAVAQSNDPSEILKLLNNGIKTSLRQSDNDESTRDGMDIVLCSIDLKNCIVKYAGANRPLWIIRKGGSELEEIKATKKAIGGLTDDSQHFNSHELQLNSGDTLYLSTDGYADTFNGRTSKKLTTKKFKHILKEIQYKTMQEQELHLDTFIEKWKEGSEQVDDILVVGIRL